MGIRAFAPAETAQRLGVDLIVTDHHLPGPDGVPKALAVVNPNQKRMRVSLQAALWSGRGLQSGAGIDAAPAGRERFRTSCCMSFMKVVAIATIADAVPLTGENRVFASLGLDALRKAVNPGLKALARSGADFRQASADVRGSWIPHRAPHQRCRAHGCGSRCDRTFQRERSGARP